jgi:hypothetical protein
MLRFNINKTHFFGVILFFFTLWDFYFGEYAQGYRLFEIYGFIFLIIYEGFVFFNFKKISLSKSFKRNSSYLFIFILVFLIGGLRGIANDWNNFFKPCLGIFLGLLTFLFFYLREFKLNILIFYLSALIYIHVFLLTIQCIIFYTFNYLINFHELIGVDPRVFGEIFRPSGLFQEPAHFALFTFMLFSLRYQIVRKFDLVGYIALFGMLLSFSFFSYLTVVIYIAFIFRKNIKLVILFALFLFILFSISNIINIEGLSYILDRVNNFSNDNSFIARYSGLENILVFSNNFPYSILGVGLTNDYLFLGSSGLGFILNAIGLLGFSILIWDLWRLAKKGNRLNFIVIFFLIMLATPLWTSLFFWAWIGLMLNPRCYLDSIPSNNKLPSQIL